MNEKTEPARVLTSAEFIKDFVVSDELAERSFRLAAEAQDRKQQKPITGKHHDYRN